MARTLSGHDKKRKGQLKVGLIHSACKAIYKDGRTDTDGNRVNSFVIKFVSEVFIHEVPICCSAMKAAGLFPMSTPA